MKKNYLYMAALALLTAACSNEDEFIQEGNMPTPGVNMITETITATNGDASTRADVDAEAKFTWSADDQIAVHVDDGKYYTATLASGEDTNEASFSVSHLANLTRDAFAIYPASIVATDATNYGQSGSALDVILPASYTLDEVSGTNETTTPCPMIAENTGESWTFSQLCGMIRLTINGIPDDATGLKIQFPNKKVNGTFSVASTVTPGTSTISTTNTSTAGEDCITVTFAAGTTTATVNLPLPTGTYDDVVITPVGSSSKVAVFTSIKSGSSYTAQRAHGKKLTTAMVAGFDLSLASFDGTVNTVPYAYIYQSNAAATSNTITIAEGQKVLLDGVNMLANGNAINCLGNAGIVLSSTNIVNSQGDNSKAIIKAGTYEPMTTLTISGSGTLEVRTKYTGSWMGAFIGSDRNGDCGNITITGGTITAIAYPKPGASEYNNSGSIGAMIGAGSAANNATSRCGNILISGGTVTVDTHKSNGTGIGSGMSENSSGNSTCGTITISGGTVTAQTNGGGAAIGSGAANIYQQNPTYGGYSKCEGIVIEGTNTVVNATSKTSSGSNTLAGAAIGTGNAGQVGSITIKGGTVNATTSYYAPGIGAGRFRSTCGDILISGGTVEATGGTDAAGIGTGKGKYKCLSTCGKITITTGVTSVKATKGTSATKCIGKGGNGSGSPGFCSCGTVTIGGVTGEISDSPYTYTPPQ